VSARPFRASALFNAPSYLILICLGHIRDFVGRRFHPKAYQHLMPRDVSLCVLIAPRGLSNSRSAQGYAPLNSDFDSFYTRRLKARMDECFGQPVTGVAGRTIMLLDRYSPDYNASQVFTGTRTRALNISSYNYLGFAQARGGCADAVEESVKRYGVSAGGARLEGGSTDLHALAEALVARFVGQEDAVISSMVFLPVRIVAGGYSPKRRALLPIRRTSQPWSVKAASLSLTS
jgi:serine palmitoyltransferase